MASWKDNLRPASFRGIGFFIDESQYTGGRRVTFHEFPDRDNPYPEDLGKVGETFKVEGYILGDNYFDTKKSLIHAANTQGPGELVHPYYGIMQVQLGAFSVQETRGEGRFAKISFQFYEAGNNNFPQQVADKQSKLEDSAANALAKSKAAFDNKFSILNAPGFVVDSAQAALVKALDAFQNATKPVKTATDAVANLAFSIRNTKAALVDLMKAPGQLSQHLQDALALLQEAVTTPLGQYTANQTLFAFSSVAEVTFMTPSRAQEETNSLAIEDFTRQQAVGNAAIAASTVTYASVSEAAAARDDLQTQIEDIVLNTTDDDVFQAFTDLHAQIVSAIPDSDIQLPSIQTVALVQTTNSLTLIYDLFENDDGEEDLINRNKIKNPAFIMPGQTLEVIDVRAST